MPSEHPAVGNLHCIKCDFMSPGDALGGKSLKLSNHSNIPREIWRCHDMMTCYGDEHSLRDEGLQKHENDARLVNDDYEYG